MTHGVGHRWTPISDLAPADLEARSQELPPLAEVWAEQRDRLGDDRALHTFNERLHREWAIETGVIERLYTLDRGTTQLLIESGVDASLILSHATDRPPELVAGIIRDQQSAVEWLFDFVAKRRPLSTSFVKELHALMTRKQQTATALDQFGRELEVPLNHGEYKQWPNNPVRPDGRIHEYCPAEHVGSEMDRLVEWHRRHLDEETPPEVEAAWLHHRFTQIHPFQDGNGRMARALATLVFIQAGWFPLVITRDDRVRYIDALEAADHGNLAPLVEVFAARQKRAFVSALGIAREVVEERERVDQVISAIGDLFSKRDAAFRQEIESAKRIAAKALSFALERFEQVKQQLETSIAVPGRDRRVFVDHAAHDDERRFWHRWQIVQAARELRYFAGIRDFSSWVRLCLDTEAGRGEILLSFHTIGHEYRGVVGASLVFFRRQQGDAGEGHISELETVCDDVFQINYKEDESAVLTRFGHWLEPGLVRALETWRRSE